MALQSTRVNQSPSHSAAFTPSRLLQMPTELIHMVFNQLQLADAAALAFSCTHFYYSKLGVEYVHELQTSKRAQFEILCRLEDDGLIQGYYCQGCTQRHSVLAFSCEELRKQARHRYCLRTKKCFYFSLTSPAASFDDMVEIFDESNTHIHNSEIDNYRAYRLFRSVWNICTICRAGRVQTRDEFIELCNNINFPVCVHMRLNDEKITSQFPPDDRVKAICSHRERVKCDLCDTELMLVEDDDYDEYGPWIELEITRYLGDLESPRDPVWLAHTFAEKDPAVDAHCEAMIDWVDDSDNAWNNWWQLPEKPPLDIEPRNGPLFTSVTLPQLPSAPPPRPQPGPQVRPLASDLWAKVRSMFLWKYFGH